MTLLSAKNQYLKLSALRVLRACVAQKDEFVTKHIIRNDIFKSVFSAFARNNCCDNLLSSAIIELCDYVRHANLKELLAYIVTNYVNSTLLELTHVGTFEQMKQQHESNLSAPGLGTNEGPAAKEIPPPPPGQRRFMEGSREESYFDGGEEEEEEEEEEEVPGDLDLVKELQQDLDSDGSYSSDEEGEGPITFEDQIARAAVLTARKIQKTMKELDKGGEAAAALENQQQQTAPKVGLGGKKQGKKIMANLWMFYDDDDDDSDDD